MAHLVSPPNIYVCFGGDVLIRAFRSAHEVLKEMDMIADVDVVFIGSAIAKIAEPTDGRRLA